MVGRNVHGSWTMSFEDRILKTKVTGATNAEAAKIWLLEAKELVLSSSEADSTPWGVLNDCREWGTSGLDDWESHNQTVDWLTRHNCVIFALVLASKIQHYSVEHGFVNQSIVNIFSDYDEAYQACLNKLSDLNGG
ncbi:hypothetical protein M9194_02145 [Vibrio sp. S4M6]|uniref:hypothetical protein n=1 Tax=Vibrio sinus TaxID=2946865 RepID=UPI00202A9204|nr:hypothetical protein [Vibrio sinus]MCL9780231.1 hypothetical protein [Vibrio sinus]